MAFLCSSSVPPRPNDLTDSSQILLVGVGSKLIVASTSSQAREGVTELTLSDKSNAGAVLCACLSSTSRQIAAATNNKELVVWRKGEGPGGWSLRGSRVLPKRAVVMRFTEDESDVILGDKTGEVHLYSLERWDTPGVHLLGHFSILVDMVLSPSNGHVITCDRDEKIRVSKFPNSYNIETFCLAHTEFVSSLSLCPKWPHILLSGSGDGTIKAWDWMVGKLLDSRSVGAEEDGVMEAVTKVCCCSGSPDTSVVVTMLEKSCHLPSFSVSSEGVLSPSSRDDSIHLSAVPWDMTFDWSDRLWVCLNDQSEPLVCYQWENNGPVKMMAIEIPLPSLCEWKYFAEGVHDNIKDWSGMRKHLSDNMGSYLARKEERIKSKKDGHARNNSSLEEDTKSTGTADFPPPTKKSKQTES